MKLIDTVQNRSLLKVDSSDEPVSLYQDVKIKRDQDGVIDKDSITKIFSKRANIRGVRKLIYDFKDKRRKKIRKVVKNGVADIDILYPQEYAKIVEFYHFEIEEKKEDNLNYIAKCLNITMDDIDIAQEKHFNDDNVLMEVDIPEFKKYVIPAWLNLDRALEIYDELKDRLRDELVKLASAGISNEEQQ